MPILVIHLMYLVILVIDKMYEILSVEHLRIQSLVFFTN